MTAGSNKTNKKGFSGLSDLVSEVSEIDTFATSEPKAERKHSGPEEQFHRKYPLPTQYRKPQTFLHPAKICPLVKVAMALVVK